MNQKTYKDYIYMNMVNYTDQELEVIYGELEAERDDYVDKWANEVAAISTEDFDPYSFFGERKLKKIANKYADPISDIDIILENIDKEFAIRERAEDENKYSGKGKPIVEEDEETFIEREKLKTMSHRTDVDN